MKQRTEVGEKEFAISYAECGVATLTSSIRRYTNKALKLAEQFPNEVKCVQNSDGSVYMIFPPEWIKFPSPRKTMSEENREKAKDRMKNAREARKQ